VTSKYHSSAFKFLLHASQSVASSLVSLAFTLPLFPMRPQVEDLEDDVAAEEENKLINEVHNLLSTLRLLLDNL
jgi:hypothetical protein